MKKQDIIYWLKKYDSDETDWQRTVEQKLSNAFQVNGFANKDEVVELLHWKFESMKGRLKRELNLIENISNEEIIEKTRLAFQSENEAEKIQTLKSISGFGNAVCSVALTFHNPTDYGVFDIHAWRELFGKEPKEFDTTKTLIIFFEKLREISRETGLTCREVEKAVFTKNIYNK